MTRDEVIAMAREAGFRTGHIDLTIGDPVPFIAPASGTSCIVEVQRFAALVATAEREACAIACEVHAAAVINDGKQSAFAIAHECASAIRARGSSIPL